MGLPGTAKYGQKWRTIWTRHLCSASHEEDEPKRKSFPAVGTTVWTGRLEHQIKVTGISATQSPECCRAKVVSRSNWGKRRAWFREARAGLGVWWMQEALIKGKRSAQISGGRATCLKAQPIWTDPNQKTPGCRDKAQ